MRKSISRLAASIALGASLVVGSLAAPTAAQAEGKIRIAEQFGIVYLLLNVVRDQHLIEKHGKEQGIDIEVDWAQLSGGSAINDALLSGSVDIAGAGVGPLLTVWDRTKGRQNVKAVASLGNFPYYLVTHNPAVKTIADFTEKDRIALPAVGVSVQSRVLQLASAKLWGDKEFAKLDKISVAVPHPDAAAEVTVDQLADWHETAASNAALRGQEARKVSESYAKSNMSVASDRHAAVAELAEAEAGFHAAAARIVRKG